ncbi:class I SAM-dependent methyltransferase [Gimibacter soli]|uniref:Class I SAM-dependent methyltransferase n=1 Tax=Gimibacter soli TaxID=3024400 RepID=A0AAE9XNU4_9PROT|nr:class I SAM-dependent methyltransferase [Gimibacter soli]WCL53467.1 class I SAM-dependent methyltransferase [Gimibacter soli]
MILLGKSGSSLIRGGIFWGIVSSFGGSRLDKIERDILTRVRKRLSASSAVLDVGCGIGNLARAIAPYVRKVVAVDPVEGMIERANMIGGLPNLEFQVKTLDMCLNNGGVYSAVLCTHVLQYVDKPDEFLRNIAKLSDDGLVMIAVACLGERRSLLASIISLMGAIGIMPRFHQLTFLDVRSIIELSGLNIVDFDILDKDMNIIWAVCKK